MKKPAKNIRKKSSVAKAAKQPSIPAAAKGAELAKSDSEVVVPFE